MDRTTLNQRSWYRALKVIFIILFLLIQASCLIVAYTISNEKVSIIHCDNGKEFDNPFLYIDDSDKLALYKKCDITAFLLLKSDVKGILTEAQIENLGILISKLQAKGALQAEMQIVVDDFKQNYADRTPDNNTVKSYTTEELTKLYGHDVSDSFMVAGSDSKWVANFTIDHREKYSFTIKTVYYTISIFIISVIFWLISRMFFYIFAKEKFLILTR